MNNFLKSFGDLFSKDLVGGFGNVKNDIVHFISFLIGVATGPVGVFVSTYDVPAIKQLLLTPTGLTPAGVVTVIVSATLTGLWKLASLSPSNSVASELIKLVPDSTVQTEINTVSTAAGNAAGKIIKMILFLLLFGLTSSAIAQDSIYKYNGGLNLSQITVPTTINGNFLALGLSGGVVPLTFKEGVVSWSSANPIALVDYLFVNGSLSPSPSGLQLKANWWIGPVLGGSAVPENNQVTVTHGFAGGTAGANIGIGNVSVTGVVDLETNQFFFGPSLGIPLDLGGVSLIQL